MLEMIIAEIAVSILLILGVLMINVWHELERISEQRQLEAEITSYAI